MEIKIDKTDDMTVVELIGDLDTNTSRDVQARLLPEVKSRGKMILKLDGVRYMSSAGLRFLLSIYRYSSNQDAVLVLVGVADEIRDTMEVTGFLDYFTACPTMEEALKTLHA
jgi:anti-sigma B factor antagonist